MLHLSMHSYLVLDLLVLHFDWDVMHLLFIIGFL